MSMRAVCFQWVMYISMFCFCIWPSMPALKNKPLYVCICQCCLHMSNGFCICLYMFTDFCICPMISKYSWIYSLQSEYANGFWIFQWFLYMFNDFCLFKTCLYMFWLFRYSSICPTIAVYLNAVCTFQRVCIPVLRVVHSFNDVCMFQLGLPVCQ